jgi:hypothetical protein
MMTGQTLAHFEVLEKLGEGGMGVVYKVRVTQLNRFVALKVLPPDKVKDLERRRRFMQEARAASALSGGEATRRASPQSEPSGGGDGLGRPMEQLLHLEAGGRDAGGGTLARTTREDVASWFGALPAARVIFEVGRTRPGCGKW